MILRYLFSEATVRVIDPEERSAINARRSKTFLQRIAAQINFWSTSAPHELDIISSQPPLSILQTCKLLNALARPIFWETIVFDFDVWSAKNMTLQKTIAEGIPLDKFQYIELGLHHLMAGNLDPDLFRNSNCLIVETCGEHLDELSSDIVLRLAWGLRQYPYRKRQSEIVVLLTDGLGRWAPYVLDVDEPDVDDHWLEQIPLISLIILDNDDCRHEPQRLVKTALAQLLLRRQGLIALNYVVK